MTTYDVLQTVRRCWYVAIGGLLLTVVACLFVLTKPGVYFSEADVYLIGPASEQARRLTDTSESIISMAGLVERKVQDFDGGEEPVSADVTLVDMGIRDGSEAILPNSGGQWSNNFESPSLWVQAVSSSAAETERLRDDQIAQIERALEEIQTTDGIAAEAQITVRQVPVDAPILYLTGRPKYAAAVAVVLGVLATMLACVLSDRWIVRRSVRRTAAMRSTV